MRGKDRIRTWQLWCWKGSPPLARERLSISLMLIAFFRITPACAGKTSSSRQPTRLYRDHPRLRGKDCLYGRRGKKVTGSPPLARERRPFRKFDDERRGITPACAGKTGRRACARSSGRDHPRLRGKDSTSASATLTGRGSPPLARERPPFAFSIIASTRITPACAGKTTMQYMNDTDNRDHPRLRGKDALCARTNERRAGSPPLARERP